MLDFRIDTFLQACHCMNYTKAAEQLNITQPAVSQHIHYLENYYHTKLFVHEGKKLKITEAGKVLQQVATTMINDENNLKQQLLNMSDALTDLRFGVTKTVGDVVVSKILPHYLKTYPDTHIRMKVGNTTELLKSMEEGNLDFALVEGYFKKSEYDYIRYSTENYIPVCSPQYRWKKKPEWIEDLFSERLLVREPGSGTREVLERYLETNNFSIENFKSTAEIGSLRTIIDLAKAGCGITFLYEAAVKEELEKGELVKIKLNKFHVYHDFTFLWRKGSVYTEIYQTLFHRFSEEREE